MTKPVSFDEIVYKVLRELVDEFKGKGYRLIHKNSAGAFVDMSETLYSGSLTPLLIWQMNRRLFYTREGREPQSFNDMFKHQLNISLFISPRTMLGAEVGEINEHTLNISKQDFLFLLRDAIYSLYHECPKMSDVFPDQKGKNELDHYVTPAMNTFISWRSIYHQINVALTNRPDLALKHGIKETIPIQLIGETLEYLNNKQKNPHFPVIYTSKPFEELLQDVLLSKTTEAELKAQPVLKAQI